MDEQEKKYQDLFTELTNYERSGVRMQMNGFPASPLQIVSAHMVREESNYMRDYILDEQGMIRELDFNRNRPFTGGMKKAEPPRQDMTCGEWK